MPYGMGGGPRWMNYNAYNAYGANPYYGGYGYGRCFRFPSLPRGWWMSGQTNPSTYTPYAPTSQPTPQQESEMLKGESEMLKEEIKNMNEQLKTIGQRITELETKSEQKE